MVHLIPSLLVWKEINWIEQVALSKWPINQFKPIQQKFVNLQYNMLGCLEDGTNKLLTKRLIFQVLFFFSWFLAKFFTKILSIYLFVILYNYKIKILSFECPKSIKSIQKIILGALDSWSTIYLSHRPSNQA